MNQLFSRTHFPYLVLLTGLLLSSCAKETSVAPAPGSAPVTAAAAGPGTAPGIAPVTAPLSGATTTMQASATGQLTMYSAGIGIYPGRNINFQWMAQQPAGQPLGPEIATSVTVDFQLNGSTVLRALDQPVASFNDAFNNTYLFVPYSIPSMLSAGTYTIVIHPSDPTKSLQPANSPQAYVTTLQDDLPVTANPVTVQAEAGMYTLPPQSYQTNVPVYWWALQNFSAGAIRIYMLDSAGLIYDPGLYSLRPTLPTGYPLGYTNNDGFENQSISRVPDGRYSFLVGSVDILYNNPGATYMAAGAIDIGNNTGGMQ